MHTPSILVFSYSKCLHCHFTHHFVNQTKLAVAQFSACLVESRSFFDKWFYILLRTSVIDKTFFFLDFFFLIMWYISFTLCLVLQSCYVVWCWCSVYLLITRALWKFSPYCFYRWKVRFYVRFWKISIEYILGTIKFQYSTYLIQSNFDIVQYQIQSNFQMSFSYAKIERYTCYDLQTSMHMSLPILSLNCTTNVTTFINFSPFKIILLKIL